MLTFLGLNLVDSLLTVYAFGLGGVELNWYRMLMETIPVWQVMMAKMILAGLCAYFVYRFRPNLFRTLNIGMLVVVVINTITLGVLL